MNGIDLKAKVYMGGKVDSFLKACLDRSVGSV